MTTTRTVYILLLSGDSEDARRLVRSRYPECTQVLLSKRALRENGWKGQVRAFRQLGGEALVIFSEALSALKEPRLLRCSAFLHNCRETVFADSSGDVRVYSRLALFGQLPEVLFSAALDLLVLIGSWMFARVLCSFAKPQPHVTADAELDVAYLYPYPFDRAAPGGAMTHVTGFLSGLAENATGCEIFSGCWMPVDQFPLHQIPNKRQLYGRDFSTSATVVSLQRARCCLGYCRFPWCSNTTVPSFGSRSIGTPLDFGEYCCSAKKFL